MFSHPPLPPGGPVALFGSPSPFEAYGFSDGSLKRHVGSCGAVVLDLQGNAIAQSSRVLSGRFLDSNEVEFQGLLDVLSSASLLRIKSLWLGVDCFEVIAHILKCSDRYLRYLTDFNAVLASFDHVHIQAIARKHNKQADRLAHQGILHIR